MVSSEQERIILNAIEPYSIRSVGIFGSYVRGENNPQSDLDILVDYEQPLDLLELIGLEQELSEKLGIKVDLVTYRSLHPHLKEKIEKELISLKK
ncbi:MAG: nucleotidyltransferase family protein [Cyclobacteriaceae bacterium]